MNLEKARQAKRVCLSDMGESSSAVRSEGISREGRPEPERLVDLLALSDEAIDTEDESIDHSFDIDVSKSDSRHIADNFCEEWVTGLEWEDQASLGLFLSFQLKSVWERERQKQKS